MLGSSLLSLALGALPLTRAAPSKRATWTLSQDYEGSSFFDGFTTFVGDDSQLTHGQVNYVSDSSLIYVDSNGHAIMKVDNTTTLASGANRNSVRISSNSVVNEGSLTIFNAAHLPYGCSVWPAFWMVGPSWPAGGEIDIFEGVNLTPDNQMTLHTSPGCTHDTSASETGTALQADCDTSVNGNSGCGVMDPDTASYGDELNSAGGGIWATLWDSTGIQIWFWTQGNEPADVSSGSPDPTGWGTPKADWPFTTCTSSFFNSLQIVFDITLCGDWAGAVYADTCGTSTCSGEVMDPANYGDAYFEVEYVKVYTSS